MRDFGSSRSKFAGMGLILGAGLCSREASARFYDMYRVDYSKNAFCAAVAGACASDDNSENSFFQNPAALESGEHGWIFDADYNPSDNLEPGMKLSSKIDQATFMGGVGWVGERWGVGMSLSGRSAKTTASATLVDDQNNPRAIQTSVASTSLVLNIPVAYQLSKSWSFGLGISSRYYYETFDIVGSTASKTTNIDKLPQLGFTAGALWKPTPKLRFGSWLRTPITFYVNQQINVQQFGNSIHIDEDLGLNFPWLLASGMSWMPWADKRTLFFDLNLIGATSDGYQRTLDTFSSATNPTSMSTARRKGATLALEPHLAWRAPWKSGSPTTYSVGTYYEDGRWQGLSGRLHGVSGVAYSFAKIGIEVVTSIDVAHDFMAFQFSFR